MSDIVNKNENLELELDDNGNHKVVRSASTNKEVGIDGMKVKKKK